MTKKKESPPKLVVLRDTSRLRSMDDEDFVPTDRMLAARSAVRKLVDSGCIAPTDWLPRLKGEMTSDEWREWQRESGFMDWWYQDLYQAFTKETLRGLAPSWFVGLQKGLLSGEPRLITWFWENFGGKGSESENELQRILTGGKGNPWKNRRLAASADPDTGDEEEPE